MLKIIAAVAANGVIGRSGQLPWRLADDMRWFLEQTGHSPVVMGRKTYWSLPARFRPLPGRENIVLSRRPGVLQRERVTILDNFSAVLKLAEKTDVFVIGGAEIYKLAIPHADEMYLTRVHAWPSGEVFFPAWHEGDWNLVSRESRLKDVRNEYDFCWEVWRHVSRPASSF